jgi:hypothetical protein
MLTQRVSMAALLIMLSVSTARGQDAAVTSRQATALIGTGAIVLLLFLLWKSFF